MRPLCQELLEHRYACSRPAVWQDPATRVWFCEEHAVPPQERAACVSCGQPAAWEHPKQHTWLCLEHRPAA